MTKNELDSLRDFGRRGGRQRCGEMPENCKKRTTELTKLENGPENLENN